MTKLPETSKATIAMGFLAANMERKLRLLLDKKNKSLFIYYDFELSVLALAGIF